MRLFKAKPLHDPGIWLLWLYICLGFFSALIRMCISTSRRICMVTCKAGPQFPICGGRSRASGSDLSSKSTDAKTEVDMQVSMS